jgi:EAL domain-containing protein (putative c-di-GMP-specific phosphodiesterase class I)
MAMATFARQTGAFVIAEGVEDEDTLAFLRRVDEPVQKLESIIQGAQGFGLGRPSLAMPEGAAELLRQTAPQLLWK